MSRASNSLKISDVLSTAIKLKYSASFYSSSLSDNGITVLRGVNGPVTTTGSVPQTTINYRAVRHLYYSNYLTGSFPVSSSAADNWLQSTAASGTLEADQRIFPTGSGEEVRVLSIPRSVFGEKISRGTFLMSSSLYLLVDDGNGNIKDVDPFNAVYLQNLYYSSPDDYYEFVAQNGGHVGNILYAQGIIIITNQNYQQIFG